MAESGEQRLTDVAGTVAGIGGAVFVANHSFIQRLVTAYVPQVGQPEPVVLSGSTLLGTVGVSIAVVFACLLPLHTPNPRNSLTTIALVQKRVLVALLALGTIGYFGWPYRLPPATLLVSGALLSVGLPAWFLRIGNQPSSRAGRALIVGDDPDRINRAMAAANVPVIGYLAPTIAADARTVDPRVMADGGILQSQVEKIDRLGGISRLETALVEYHVDTVILAFENADRGEFFGVLEVCHVTGVETRVLREHADSVLLSEEETGGLMTVDLEPWDWRDRLFKRGFDVVFSSMGLIGLAPLFLVIALAIKLDSPGPVLYSQERTSWFGGTFRVQKFRSMIDDAEAKTGAVVSAEDAGDVDPRVTRVGRILRKTHLDEIPQLWAILVGDMSVVGPRPERPALDEDIQASGVEWERRWFVKPGLTGLAQIRDATGFEPERKLELDLEYIQRQSLPFDVRIVLRQLWTVVQDVRQMLQSRMANG